MKELLPGFKPQEALNCKVAMCRLANEAVSEDQRECLYMSQTNPLTELVNTSMSAEELLNAHNYLKNKCLYGEQVFSSRKNSQ